MRGGTLASSSVGFPLVSEVVVSVAVLLLRPLVWRARVAMNPRSRWALIAGLGAFLPVILSILANKPGEMVSQSFWKLWLFGYLLIVCSPNV